MTAPLFPSVHPFVRILRKVWYDARPLGHSSFPGHTTRMDPKTSTSIDADLLTLIAKGDRRAFGQLYDRSSPFCLRYWCAFSPIGKKPRISCRKSIRRSGARACATMNAAARPWPGS